MPAFCSSNRWSKCITVVGVASACVFSAEASELDYSLTVFGTAGYAITDTDYRYDRTSERGTFSQDSRVGVQLDFNLSPQLSATVQAKFEPANDREKRWEPTLSWAFLSWRAGNSLLLRAGKLRIPAFLYTENMDVGLTYHSLRLPPEIYRLTPFFDVVGLSVDKTWDLGNDAYLAWGGYLGTTSTTNRVWFRSGIPGALKQGSTYLPLRATVGGTVLSWSKDEDLLRFGLHYATVCNKNAQKWLMRPYRVPFGNTGQWYYPVTPTTSDHARNTMRLVFLTAAVNWALGNDFYFTGEAVKRSVLGMTHGYDSTSFYLQLRRSMGRWTPYITYAYQRSRDDVLQLVDTMNASSGIPMLDQLNHAAADRLLASNQYSWMIGTSFDINSSNRIKFEYMRTHVRNASSNVSAMPGQDFQNKNINMFSVVYNFVY